MDLMKSLRFWLIAWNPGFGKFSLLNVIGLTMLFVPVAWALGYFVVVSFLHNPIVSAGIAYFAFALIAAGWGRP